MNYIDKLELNGNEHALLGVGGDQTYPGCDLAELHAEEIKSYTDVWAWIKARITNANWSQIHVGDWIPFTTTNNVTIKARVAGIDTYYRYGNAAVPHHIDFISRTVWPTAFKMNLVNFNNGISDAVKSPWLASNGYHFINSLAGSVPNGTAVGGTPLEAVDYTSGGIFYYLPQALKNVIVAKRFYAPTRYSASGLQSQDNSADWIDLGKLWLPTEYEVMGACINSGTGWTAGGGVQYPLFAHSMNRLMGTTEAAGSRSNWWTCSAYAGNTANFVLVYYSGQAYNHNASGASYAPVCFRISA